jgi:hypothetical protein
MPTLQDVANQIKDDLDQIKSSTALTASRLDALTQHLDAGDANLGQGLFAILEVDRQVAVLLQDNVTQNQTIICWLRTQADVQCRILQRLDALIAIDTATRDAVVEMEQILERAYPAETLDIERINALEAKIAECCPPRQEPPQPCFEPCREGELETYTPKGQDWQPMQVKRPG